MVFGPMTWIVVTVLGALLVVGISILARAGGAASLQCSRCKHVNRSAAKFCARCGQSLAE